VIQMEDLTLWVMLRVAKFPRDHRFTLGDRLIEACLTVLDDLVHAAFSRDKVGLLTHASRTLTRARTLVRLAHRAGVLSEKQRTYFAEQSDEVGRKVSGWTRFAAPAPGRPPLVGVCAIRRARAGAISPSRLVRVADGRDLCDAMTFTQERSQLSSTVPVSWIFVASLDRHVGRPSRQVGSAMQEIDDDHLRGILDEDDEVLTRSCEAQILGQVWVDEPPAVLRRGGARCDVPARGNQVFLIGRGLSRPECLERPLGNVHERGFRALRQTPGLQHQHPVRAAANARRMALSPFPSARSPRRA